LRSLTNQVVPTEPWMRAAIILAMATGNMPIEHHLRPVLGITDTTVFEIDEFGIPTWSVYVVKAGSPDRFGRTYLGKTIFKLNERDKQAVMN
jgi:hypothetical protein